MGLFRCLWLAEEIKFAHCVFVDEAIMSQPDNHTSSAISHVKVNGYGGPNISPFGDGGGYCCVQLPDKWKPGLKAHIEWEVDPHTAPPFPGYKDRRKFNSWKSALEDSF